MAKFRKIPVVVEAFLPSHAGWERKSGWPAWLREAISMPMGDPGSVWQARSHVGDDHGFAVHTREGVMFQKWGGWIIKGVEGELYPCKPCIFDMTYEPA